MADLLQEIKALSLEDVVALQARARKGDRDAAVKFIQWSIWRKIDRDEFIPAGKRAALFYLLMDVASMHVTFEPGPTPPAHAPPVHKGTHG